MDTTAAGAATTVVIPFTITRWEEAVYDEPAEGPRLTRIEVEKRFTGALTGTSTAHVLTAQGPDGAGYMANERVTATLDGREGTFVLQHGAMGPVAEGMRRFGHVVAGSATGALTGLTGDVAYDRTDAGETLTFTYTLP